MLKEIKFALYSVRKNLESSAELRASFVANIIGMTINNSAFITIWVFFVRSVGVINGWTPIDIVALLGFGSLSYGIIFSVGFGIRKLPDYVASGGFDRFMLSPKNLLVRVATSAMDVSALGDIVFGLACLTIYCFAIHASVLQVVLLIFMVMTSALATLAACIAAHSASFLFTDGHSVASGLFEVFLTPSLFHGGAFQGVMRFVFTFLVPSLAIGAIPVEVVKSLSPEKLLIVASVSVAWFILSLKLFSMGVKKYESSNFMTFRS